VKEPELVLAAARFISSFAVKEESCNALIQCGALPALLACFDDLADPDLRATLLVAIEACAGDAEHFLEAKWMPQLAKVLYSNPSHLQLHEAGLGVLRALSRIKTAVQEIASLGFVRIIIAAMQRFPNSVAIQREASAIIGNLATDAALRLMLCKVGAVQQTVATLKNCPAAEDRKVAKLALGALANLAASEANREVMANCSAAAATLGVARTFLRNEHVLEYAILAISHLALHDGCAHQLLEAGALEALLLFLQEHGEDLLIASKSLVALGRLLRSDDVEAVSFVACSGCQGASLLLETLKAHIYDDVVVREASKLLTILCSLPGVPEGLLSPASEPCLKALKLHQNEQSASDALVSLLANLPLEDGASLLQGMEGTLQVSERRAGY